MPATRSSENNTRTNSLSPGSGFCAECDDEISGTIRTRVAHAMQLVRIHVEERAGRKAAGVSVHCDIQQPIHHEEHLFIHVLMRRVRRTPCGQFSLMNFKRKSRM